MALDIAVRKNREKAVPIDCGDGDSFTVILKPGTYSWDELMTWSEKLGTITGSPTREQAEMLMQWAKGVIAGFDGLVENGEPVGTDRIGDLGADIVGLIFSAVTEGLSVGKANPTA